MVRSGPVDARSAVLVVVGSCAAIACGPPSWPEVEEPADEPVVLSVVPADPIAGEHVELVVPVRVDGACHAFGGTVRSDDSSPAILTIEPTTPDACAVAAAAPSGSLIALGELGEGAYVVRVGEHEVPFEVLPATTSPGAPPLWWRAAHAVAVANHVGSACADDLGERAAGAGLERPFRVRAPRLHHQVAAAHPDWDAAAVETAMCVAQSVQVRAISDTELRYRHDWSSLCHLRTAIGTVHVGADGTLRVDAPHVIDGGDVDC